MPLILHYGNAVSGDQRFDRPALQARLLRTMESSGGIKMFGLRRIGKSTLRRYLVKQAEAKGQAVAYFDAQGLHSIQDLLAELFRSLPKDSLTKRTLELVAKDSPIRSLLEALARGTRTGDQVVAAYWREAYNGIRDALGETTQPPILIIDEFSLLLRNVLEQDPDGGRDEINQLLAAMREWRGAGMRMLLTGSIGVAALARRHGLDGDHLNDLLPFEVPELTEDEARDFYAQFDKRFRVYGEIDSKMQRALIVPVLKHAMETDGAGALEDLPLPDGYSLIDRSEILVMLVEDGFIHFTEDVEGRRHWRPASRLARLWWRRSGLA